MTTQHKLDLIEVLTAQDGEYNQEINAQVTAYPLSEDVVQFELEYLDRDNEDEVIEVVRFTIKIEE